MIDCLCPVAVVVAAFFCMRVKICQRNQTQGNTDNI